VVMRKHGLRLFMPFLLAGVFFATTLSYAATAARITSAVVESERTTLKGNISPMARAEFDQGAVSDSQQMTHMRVMLSRTAAQETALKQLVADQMNPSSANYHKWLTPEQMGEEFGPSADDVATVESWLQAKGFTIEYVSPARTNIRFSGDAALVESAFQTSVHQFNTGTRSFYSNTTEPQIPSALATVVSGIAHMNSIKPQPHLRSLNTAHYDPQGKTLSAGSTSGLSSQGVSAQLTYSESSTNYLMLVPGDAATIYDTPNSFNANYNSSVVSSQTGSGVTIGIGGDGYITSTPIVNYRTKFLGDSTTSLFNTTAYPSTDVTSRDTSDSDEAYLDMEIAGGLAPGATVKYFASSDLTSAAEYAFDNKLVNIFSLSFGECEWDMSTSDNSVWNSLWQNAASYGIAVTVSSGDSGSAGCDNTTTTNNSNTTAAEYGLQVNGLASTPYNVAVGGTDFYTLENSYSTYADTTNSSSNYYRTAKSWIPEYVWNDSSVTDTYLAKNEDWTSYGSKYAQYANIVAGGGGYSNCSTNTTTYSGKNTVTGNCTSGYSKPLWQTGTGVSSSISYRQIPDVSLMAGDGFDGAAWLVCTDTYNCSSTLTYKASSGYYAYGGTSTAAPAFAGILALVRQYTNEELGNAAETLYSLYNGSYASNIYHDNGAGYGNNSVPCTSGTTNCSKNTAGYYFLTGYDATSGYDMATGLGSVDASYLVKYWSTGASSITTGTTTSTVTVTPSPSSISSSSSSSVTVKVAGSGSTPTGSVTLNYGSTADTESLTSGSYTFTVPGSALTSSSSGTSNTLTATYWGDSTYAGGSGSNTVTVTSSYYAVALSPASGSVSKGSSTTSTVTLSSSNSYSGTVALTCAVTTTMTSYSSSYMPTCAFSQTSVTMTSGTASATPTLTISTTGSTSSRNTQPMLPGRTGIGGGVVLAVLLFCIPARRRKWRVMLGALLLMVGIGVVSGCNGGSGSSSSSGGTTSGTYTVTVTGTGNDSSTTKETATFTLTVK